MLSLAAAACGHGRSDDTAPSRAADHYTARGKIMGLPTAAHREISIHHERLATFKTEDGKIKPMMSMEMPFGVPTTISLAGLNVGDAVTFGFDVQWTGSPPLLLTNIEKLPAGTGLVLE